MTITSEQYKAYLELISNKAKLPTIGGLKPRDFIGNEIKVGGWVAFPVVKISSGSRTCIQEARFVTKVNRDTVLILDKKGRRNVKVPPHKLVWLGFEFPNKPSEDEIDRYVDLYEDKASKAKEELEEFAKNFLLG